VICRYSLPRMKLITAQYMTVHNENNIPDENAGPSVATVNKLDRGQRKSQEI